ncbi:hypothetical protein BJX70DRAFT_109599 [Aspergillus crustosus]
MYPSCESAESLSNVRSSDLSGLHHLIQYSAVGLTDNNQSRVFEPYLHHSVALSIHTPTTMRKLQHLLSTAPIARPIPSCLPSPSRLCPQLRTASNPQIYTSLSKPQSLSQSPFRIFTTTTSLATSPFRLSSTPSQPPSETPDPNLTSEGEEDSYYSPYQPKRTWPPDLSKLSPKHQFRLERKYRRRAALKYARPKWMKATKLVQWGGIGFVLLYALLFMEWDERGGKGIDELRDYIFGTVKGAFSAPPPPASVRRSEESAAGSR